MKIMLDMPINHTSPNHEWFIEYLNNSLEILLNEIDKYSKSITINNLEQVLITSTKEQIIINNVKNAYVLVKEEGIILLKETNGIDYIEQNNGYFISIRFL